MLTRQHHDFIHVAPDPVFSWLEGLYDRMLRGVKVLGGVFVLGRVAATNVAAGEAFPEVHPGIACL